MHLLGELLVGAAGILLQQAQDAQIDAVFEQLKQVWGGFDILVHAAGVGALVVMDAGRLVGVLSERDYTRKIALQVRNSKETRVADIMTRDVITVTTQTRSREAMALMSQRKIRHLPVLDGARVVGMLSIRDILDDIIASQEETISQLTNYIAG